MGHCCSVKSRTEETEPHCTYQRGCEDESEAPEYPEAEFPSDDNELIKAILEQRLLAATLKSETTKAYPRLLQLHIQPESIQLYFKDRHFFLRFDYWSESACTLRLYVYAREDPSNGDLLDEHFLQTESLPATERQESAELCILNFKQVSSSVVSDIDRIPLALEIEDRQSSKYRVCMAIHQQAALYEIEVLRQAVKLKDAYYILQTIYEDQDAGNVCLICCTNKAELLLVPCHHIAVCRICMLSVMRTRKSCPLCRKAIDEFVRLKEYKR